MSTLVDVLREIRASLLLWLALLVAFFAAFPLLQLALLIVRFQELPNYLIVHDWPGNIARIVRMTPSIADMVSIMRDEWLIEIGSMNFAYGHGIAEWSFVLVPAKAGVTLVIALLLATNVVLLRAVRKTCPLSARLGASAAAAGGALLAGAATMTITWVVCCAAPTWVVGLAVLGVSVATAFALQPIGGWLSLFGIVLLAAIAAALVRCPDVVAAHPLRWRSRPNSRGRHRDPGVRQAGGRRLEPQSLAGRRAARASRDLAGVGIVPARLDRQPRAGRYLGRYRAGLVRVSARSFGLRQVDVAQCGGRLCPAHHWMGSR
jgi:hypothetical protein